MSAAIANLPSAVFADHQDAGLSRRYGFVSTAAILVALGEQGWRVTSARQTRVRSEGAGAFAKHIVRLSRTGVDPQALMVGDVVPQLVLVNAHNGRSSCELWAGMHRKVCDNGLIVAISDGEGVRVRHMKGSIMHLVADAQALAGRFREVGDKITQWTKLEMSATQASQFATRAMALRWPQGAPVKAEALLVPRRRQDHANDLWTVMNRVQENIVRGGMRGVNARRARCTVVPITAIDAEVRINRALWALTEQVYQAA